MGCRIAALRPDLEEALELAVPGEEYVVGGVQGDTYRKAANTPKGWINCNLRTSFEKLIRRACLKAWPRPFHNLRSSCETDLMRDHPIHAVTSWLCNTPAVALKHYLQVLDIDFEKACTSGARSGAVAMQKAVQTASNGKRQEAEERTKAMIFRLIVSFRPLLSVTVQMNRWACSDSNREPRDYESPALTVELQARSF